jgi:hypothetical protein
MKILLDIWSEAFVILFKDLIQTVRGDILWRVYYFLSLLPF